MRRSTRGRNAGATTLTTAIGWAATALVALALWARAREAPRRLRVDLDPTQRPVLAEPAQLLRPGGERRSGELEALLTIPRAPSWAEARRIAFGIADCPPLEEWIHSATGQDLERALVDLRDGGEADALAALALIMQLARVTRWEPGMLARTQHSEQLGRLLEDWLLARAERGVDSPLLHDAVMHAFIAWGAVMRRTYNAPLIGRREEARERARGVLQRLLGAGPQQRSALGRAVAERFPRAVALFDEKEDILRGFDEEAQVLFPELDGECGR